MASRNPNDLHPTLFKAWGAFDRLAREQKVDYILTCTWRSPAEQDALYAKGRTDLGSIVTNAKAGESAHNWMVGGKPASKAFDVVPIVDGKPEWGVGHPAWKTLGKIGEAVGLEWAGRWKTFKEFPHFQLPNWKEK